MRAGYRKVKRSICTPQKWMEKQKKIRGGVQERAKASFYPAEGDGEAEKESKRGTEK